MITLLHESEGLYVAASSSANFDYQVEYFDNTLYTDDGNIADTLKNLLIPGMNDRLRKLLMFLATNKGGSTKTLTFYKRAASVYRQISPALDVPAGNSLLWTPNNWFQIIDTTP